MLLIFKCAFRGYNRGIDRSEILEWTSREKGLGEGRGGESLKPGYKLESTSWRGFTELFHKGEIEWSLDREETKLVYETIHTPIGALQVGKINRWSSFLFHRLKYEFVPVCLTMPRT